MIINKIVESKIQRISRRTIDKVRLPAPFGYLLKPFEERELHTTIEMALYKSKAEEERAKLTQELQESLAMVKKLSGLLPICASCKKIRNGKDNWEQIETYIHNHSDADFTHGVCPDCFKTLYADLEYRG